MRGRDFCERESQNSTLPKQLQRLTRHINRLRNNLSQEKNKMTKQRQADRKARAHQLIQIGGLVKKSGLVDAFLIVPGDDLQAHENLEKASRLLGFLSTCFEEKDFNEENLEAWQSLGSRLLRYDLGRNSSLKT